MFLIDKPYVSDFLIKTLKDFQFPVIANKQAKSLILDDEIHWISEEKAIQILKDNPQTSIYTNSENAIAWIEQHLSSSKRAQQIQLFKDKAGFRELVKDLYPNFFYKTVNWEEIQYLNIEDFQMPFVIKPNFGFFSLGVYIIHSENDWKIAQKDLSTQLSNHIYPPEVLSTSSFIIEEYIEGEEYAIDSYFDEEGKVTILNILHHRFSSGTDISDRVYSTSKKIVLSLLNPLEKFLQTIGNRMDLKNFPLHFEVRVDAQGKIHAIEGNPMRFGGLCTTADLSGLALGLNSYVYFMEKRKPNWEEIFRGKEDKIFSLIVLNNSSGYADSSVKYFDYDLLAQDFEKVINMRKLNILKQTVFGFVFTETSQNNTQELDSILVSDLRKYIQVFDEY